MKISDWNHNGSIDTTAVRKTLKQRESVLRDPRYSRYADALAAFKALKLPVSPYTIKNGVVRIGAPDLLAPKQRAILQKSIQAMIPWRKGPFTLFGERLDAEWRSDLKWERVKKRVGPLQGKAVLDIGCNNGYYLFQMARQKPKLLLGIDPVVPYHFQYKLLSRFTGLPNTDAALLGIEDLAHFDSVFDVVFCMGILYHHTDPIGLLRLIWQSLRPGGMLIVESQGIGGSGSYALLPEARYLGMPGFWFLPTKEAHETMIRRAGFSYVDTFEARRLDAEEQRRTELSPHESLTDGLDEQDPLKTKEGHPAPWRFYVKAHKARRRR